jgi:hypothetical protein
MTPIITLFGKSGSGKSTAGQFLIEAYGGESLAFADPMKKICKEIFDFTHDQLYGDSETRNKLVDISNCPGRWASHNSTFPSLFIGESFERISDALATWIYGLLGKNPISPRQALVTLGEMAKTIDANVWTRHTINKALKLLEEGKKFVVITDGRFPLEAVATAKLGGKNILIRRSEYESTTDPGHISETSINNISPVLFDYKIINSSNLSVLKADCLRLGKEIGLDGIIKY